MSKILLILICATLFFQSSCSRPYTKDSLRMNLGSEPGTLDWNLASDSNSFDIISNIMIGLTRFSTDSEGKIIVVPGCAKSWEISQDTTEYIFHLNPKLEWTDGKKIQAQDFIDSFKRINDPELAAPYSELLAMIDLEQSKALDNLTLKIKLKHPAAYFIYLTAHGITFPIRKDIINKHPRDWTEAKHIVTNGPFFLKEWQHEYKIKLERNPSFYLGSTKPNQVKSLSYFMVQEQSSAYTLYLNNQFDWIDSRSIPIGEYSRIKNSERSLLLRNTYIGFNTHIKPLDNPLVRQALSLAIKREDITKIKNKGDLANHTWIPPSLNNLFDYDKFKNYQAYNPDLARTKLALAGFPSGKGFPELEFLIPSREDSKLLAESLQSMWAKELNIRIKITAMEWKTFLNNLRSNPPAMFRLNWGADYPDPDTFMQLFTSNNPMNYGKFSNAKYDELIKKAAAIQDTRTRKVLYTQAEEILTKEEAGIAALYIDTQTILKKPWLKNIEFNPMDIMFLEKAEISR